MYSLLLALLVGGSIALIVWGGARRSAARVAGGVALGVTTLAFFWLLGFWAEMLWFGALGFSGRFWTEVLARWGLGAAGAVGGLGALMLLTWPMSRERLALRVVGSGVAALVGASWAVGNWTTVLQWAYGVETGVRDPILNADAGFYLFSLPLYDQLQILTLWMGVLTLLLASISEVVRIEGGLPMLDNPLQRVRPFDRPRSLYVGPAVVLASLAWRCYLWRYHLMYSRWGAVTGAGWTDVHVRLPGYWVMAALLGAGSAAMAVGAVRPAWIEGPVRDRLERNGAHPGWAPAALVGSLAAVLFVTWFVVLGVVPGTVQWLRVQPNEITFEREYIEHNIAFTRRGFALDRVEQRRYPGGERFTQETVDRNEALFENIRLWDWRALARVYKQFQEIRLYYQFHDVDIDRYRFGGDEGNSYRQVMVSAREIQLENLADQSQTFVNRHFKYTHGNGVTLSTVSEFTPEGLPNLLVKDIPPVTEHPALAVDRPQIYYGELTDNYAVVNTSEGEFDYPSGEENRYIHYPGSGGVEIGSLWRRFVFGWTHGGTRLLLSEYPRAGSRLMFRRDIRRRVRAVAPFLELDDDPYIVQVDGKLKWIIDAYTTSRHYPYSEPFSAYETLGEEGGRSRRLPARTVAHLHGVNYLRNSVKAVVDAFNGDVQLYVMDEDDPVLRVWRRIFPEIFTPRERMPEGLFAHVRYPVGMLLVQGLVYAKYHMTDAEVFYNQEDLWVRATEKYYQNVQPVEPYYIMWEPPDANAPQFTLMLPFTPKNRQVLIGWIAGMCDGENYGRFLAYQFPKEKRMIGPQQVESKIDQDPDLSATLTLWDQRGSSVIRGNVLAIPVEETLFYVEPIYLQAETAAYPELRRVVVMHNDRLGYAETFAGALQDLFSKETGDERPAPAPGPGAGLDASAAELIDRANRRFEQYLRLTGEGRLEEASASLQRVRELLGQLKRRSDANE